MVLSSLARLSSLKSTYVDCDLRSYTLIADIHFQDAFVHVRIQDPPGEVGGAIHHLRMAISDFL